MADRAFHIHHDLPTLSFSRGDVRGEAEFPAWTDFDRLLDLGAISQADGEPITKGGAITVYKGQIAGLKAENDSLRQEIDGLKAENDSLRQEIDRLTAELAGLSSPKVETPSAEESPDDGAEVGGEPGV